MAQIVELPECGRDQRSLAAHAGAGRPDEAWSRVIRVGAGGKERRK
jgi:hypothetical protein